MWKLLFMLQHKYLKILLLIYKSYMQHAAILFKNIYGKLWPT